MPVIAVVVMGCGGRVWGGGCTPSPGKKIYKGSVVTVSASYRLVGCGGGVWEGGCATLMPTRTPAVPWPYLKVIFSVDMFFECLIMCILFSSSGECF